MDRMALSALLPTSFFFLRGTRAVDETRKLLHLPAAATHQCNPAKTSTLARCPEEMLIPSDEIWDYSVE